MQKDLLKTISLPTSRVNQRITLALAAAAVTIAALFMPLHRADAALIDRVNEAIREAGAMDTVERSNAFQTGVYIGHYTTYEQLRDAVSWHKSLETLPEFTATEPTIVTSCITGDVTSLSYTSDLKSGSITVEGNVPATGIEGFVVDTVTLGLASNQHELLTEKGVVIGSNVDACWATSSTNSLYGHVSLN